MGSQYWIKLGEKVGGPLSSSQIRQLTARGRIKASHKISLDRRHWFRVSQIKALHRAKELADAGMGSPQAACKSAPVSPLSAQLNLEQVHDYEPSGRCSCGGRLFLLLPVVSVATALAGGLASLVGALLFGLFGFVGGGCMGYLAKVFMPDTMGEVAGTLLQVGGWAGGAMGLTGGLVLVGAWASRVAQNRSRVIAILFGISVTVCLLVFYLASWFAIPALHEFGAWGFLGFLLTLCLTGILGSVMLGKSVQDQPYCEECQSYTNQSHVAYFAASIEDIRRLAQTGDSEGLAVLKHVPEGEAQSIVRLDTCPHTCCGRLQLIDRANFIWHQAVAESASLVGKPGEATPKPTKSDVVVSGMVNHAAKYWLRILSPGCSVPL